jgi:hypothetical protein
MTKDQVYDLLEKIETAYPIRSTEITQERIDIFYESLANHDVYSVADMWKRHVDSGNRFPPTLGDLIPTKRREQASEIYSSELAKWSNSAADLDEIQAIIQATKSKLKGVRV